MISYVGGDRPIRGVVVAWDLRADLTNSLRNERYPLQSLTGPIIEMC